MKNIWDVLADLAVAAGYCAATATVKPICHDDPARQEYPQVLLDWAAYHGDSATFWRRVIRLWPMAIFIPHAEFAAAFRRHRHAWAPSFMATWNQAAYESLPDMMTIYRGQRCDMPLGLTWSLRRDAAERYVFSRHHRIFERRAALADIAFV